MNQRWLYLHFLDRELLTACGVYGKLSQRRLSDDFVVALLTTSGPSYVATSVLFESDYAFSAFETYRVLFARQDIIRLAGTSEDLYGFVCKKKSDYEQERARYERYFNDAWKRVEDVAPTMHRKITDTTKYLQLRLQDRIAELSLSVGSFGYASSKESAIKKALVDALIGANGKPITSELFASTYDKLSANDLLRCTIAIQISLLYVESYMHDLGGVIPTGLKSGLGIFDSLSDNWPAHHLNAWRDIYAALGVYPKILDCPASDIAAVRDASSYPAFVSAVSNWLQGIERHDDSKFPEVRVWERTRNLCEIAQRCKVDDIGQSFVSAITKAMTRFLSMLDREPNQTKRSVPARGFRLDVLAGTLQLGSKDNIQLSDACVRVLFALVGEMPKLKGAGALGYLSDRAIAAIYLGN